jgi:RNA polymerase sigma factor (sigma-70 family)
VAQDGADDEDELAGRFEEHRGRLRAVAFRMLGSLSEAEDAVQESWLRLSRTDGARIENLGAWLTTVVTRLCLDVLRSRRSRREEPLDGCSGETAGESSVDPEAEAVLAEEVGLALLVVLDTLAPAERVAFVLHDLFELPFDRIAEILNRTPNAARLLASRARRRVGGRAPVPGADLVRQREVVSAFFAASRRGDFEALLALLDPEAELRADAAAVPTGARTRARGAAVIAKRAPAYAQFARLWQPALVNGAVGAVVAALGERPRVLEFAFADGRITGIEIIADPDRLSRLDLAVLVD